MPSKDREARKRRLLDQPGLSPQQAKDIEQSCDVHARNEDARIVGVAQQDIARYDVMNQEQQDRLKEFVMTKVADGVAQAKSRRLSAKEIAALRDEVQQVIAYYEGDDERQGILSTLESGYARADAIIEDPGAAADEFYRRWPTLAESRYR
jgi:hypothetical protein